MSIYYLFRIIPRRCFFMPKKKEEKKAKQEEQDLFDEPHRDEHDFDIEFDEESDSGEDSNESDSRVFLTVCFFYFYLRALAF